MRGETRRAGGLRWHVETGGRGPVLLAVHGTGASSHSFARVAPFLEERFTVVAPDLPGHARTPLPAGFIPSLDGIADGLAALLAAMGAEPSVALGHSAGAAVLAHLALTGRCRASLLVGVAAALEPLHGLAGALYPPTARWLARERAARAIAASARAPGMVASVLGSTGARLDPDGVAAYRELVTRPAHVLAVLTMMAHWDVGPVARALPGLDRPLLLLAGEHDRAVPPARQRAVAARVPGARLQIVPETGHLPHEERPGLVARLVHAAADRPADAVERVRWS